MPLLQGHSAMCQKDLQPLQYGPAHQTTPQKGIEQVWGKAGRVGVFPKEKPQLGSNKGGSGPHGMSLIQTNLVLHLAVRITIASNSCRLFLLYYRQNNNMLWCHYSLRNFKQRGTNPSSSWEHLARRATPSRCSYLAAPWPLIQSRPLKTCALFMSMCVKVRCFFIL